MHQSELEAMDLNLLVTLDVLLDARSVTQAARRLGRTQSAVSHALARLREAFDDPLLVRRGNAMVPTPRADALAPQLARVLGELKRLLAAQPVFEASTSERRFRLAAPDLLAPLLPPLIAALGRAAPRVELELVAPLRGGAFERLSDGSVDLAVEQTPSAAGGVIVAGVGQVRFAVAGRAGHPFLDRPSAAAWCRHPHVIVSSEDASRGFVGELARAAGLARRVGLRVPTFLLAVHVIAQTELLFTAPQALLEPLAEPLGLELAPFPLRHRPIPVAAMWHERLAADPGHQWFRAFVSEQLRGLLAD